VLPTDSLADFLVNWAVRPALGGISGGLQRFLPRGLALSVLVLAIWDSGVDCERRAFSRGFADPKTRWTTVLGYLYRRAAVWRCRARCW